MFDLNKADARQKAIYDRLSATDRVLVDGGYADIEEFASVLNAPTASAVTPKSVPLPATQAPSAESDSYVGLLEKSVKGVGYKTAGEAARYTADELPSDLASFPGWILEKLTNTEDDPEWKGETTPFGQGVPLPAIPGLGEKIGKPVQQAGKAILSDVERQRQERGIGHGWDGGIAGMGLDIAQNPDSVAGLAGGLLSKTGAGALVGQGLIAIPTSRVYLDKYYALIDQGVPEEEAKARAAIDAGIEYATENLSFGGAKVAKPLVTSSASKILKSAGIEALEETAAELGQGGIDNIISAYEIGSEELQAAAGKNKFNSLEDAAKRASYAAMMGGVMGAGLRGVTSPFETKAEIKSFEQRAADMLERGRAASILQQRMVEEDKPTIGVLKDVQLLPSEVKKTETPNRAAEEDKAYAQNEARKEAEKTAAFQAMEAEKVKDTNPVAKALVDAGLGTKTPPASGTLKAPVDPVAQKAKAAREIGKLANEQEAKELAKKKEAALKAATKKYDAARTDEEIRLGREMAANNLPDFYYAEGMKAWDAKNPAPTLDSVKPEAETKGRKGLSRKSEDINDLVNEMKTISQKQNADATIVQQRREEGMPKSAPVPARGKAVKNPTKNLLVTMKNQTADMQPREMNALEAGIKSGKIQVVPSNFKVGGEALGNANGLYDGKTIYINQDRLDAGMRIMDIANHEVDHYFKHSKNAPNIKSLLSGKVNIKPTVSKIEVLAKNKNPVAVKALRHAEAARDKAEERERDDIYQEELVSYFHQFATEASRKGMLASARSAFQDIQSMLKDKVLGTVDEVKDSGYVSRKRLENLDKADTAEDVKRESIGGKKATSFQHKKDMGETWTGSDGKERFWISDNEATFNINNWANIPLTGKRNTTAKPFAQLDDILIHKKLYDEYPELRNIPVYKYDENSDTRGFMQPGKDGKPDAIWLNQKYHGNTIASARKNLLTILHENQHAIQQIENFAKGTNPTVHENAIKSEAISQILRTMKDAGMGQQILDRIAFDEGYNDYNDFVNDVNSGEDADVPVTTQIKDKVEVLEAIATGNNARAALATALDKGYITTFNAPDLKEFIEKYRNAVTTGFARYQNHSGERESRMVESMYNPNGNRLMGSEEASDAAYEYRRQVQAPGEIIGDLDSEEPAGAFRQKGEGEISPSAYDAWAEAMGNFDEDEITDMKWALRTGKMAERFGYMDPVEMESHVQYDDWVRKVTKRYLDKYAGTPEDPLKDIILPDGDRWEDLMDAAVQYSGPNPKISGSKRIFSPSTEFLFRDEEGIVEGEAAYKIKSYLAHVGDYMHELRDRQDIDLNRYDLVRAVKETYADDQKKLKLAEKAKAKADSNLTVVRKYADGTRWVKLDKPGQFAAESDIMGHSVRGYEPPAHMGTRMQDRAINADGSFAPDRHPDWTPESGDSGHEYYGHGGWEAIKSGKAEVYSLRDKDGKSHVTIEIEKKIPYGQYTGTRLDTAELRSWQATQGSSRTITQIKGKGNAKPVDKYIPFVQDFVRNMGPWEAVQDLYNADMGYGDYTKSSYFTADEIREAENNRKDLKELPIEGLPSVVTSQQAAPQNQEQVVRKSESLDENEPQARSLGQLLSGLISPRVENALRTGAGIFTTAKAGRVLREMNEASQGFVTEYSITAEANYNDLTKALKEAEDENPNFNWIEFWTRVENEENAEQRDRIIGAMAREFPEVARSYRMFRDSIDNLTDLIVMERVKKLDTEPFSDKTEEGRKEIALYKALIKNKGRYTTRAYLLSKGKTGDLYGELSWKAYQNARKAIAKEEEVDPQDAKAAERVAAAFAYYQRVLNIPEELPENIENLRELHSAWFPTDDNTSIHHMREALEERRKTLSKDEVNANVEQTIQEILGITPERAGFLAARVRGMQRDNTIMESRKNVPKVIRDLMGEVDKENMPLKFFLTLTAQANYLARTRFLAEVAEDPNLSIPSEDRYKPGNEKFIHILRGKQWGALNGRYVTPWTLGILTDHKTIPGSAVDAMRLLGAGKTAEGASALVAWAATKWGNISGTAKYMKIVMNPMNYIYNSAGNVFNLMRSGFNINPKYMGRAIAVARQMIGSKSLREVSDDTRMINRMGVLDSAQVGELMVEALDIIKDEVHRQTMPENRDVKIKKKFRQGASWLREVYAMTDVVSKISNAMYMLDQYSEYYALNGDKKSQSEIERIVADRIKDENVTFSRAAPILKGVERIGLTWFGTYIGETFRTQVGNLANIMREANMAREAKTSEARKKAIEIVVRHAAGTMVSTAMVTALLSAIAGAGDDEKDEGWKRFLPQWARIGAPMILGKNKEGYPLVLTLSRFDPVGPVMDLLRAGQEDDLDGVMATIRDLYVKPTVGIAVWDAINAETNRDSRDAVKRVGESFLPSLAVNWFKYDYPQNDDILSQIGKATRLVGGRLETANPRKAIRNAATEFHKIQSNGRKDVYDSLREGDTDQLIEEMQEYRVKEHKAFRELVELDQAMVAVGYTPRQRRTILEGAGLSKVETEQVFKGHNIDGSPTNLLNVKSVRESLKNTRFREGDAEFKRSLANAQKTKKQLEQLGYKFKE